MSGSGFDHSTTTYSPEGRVFQVEYAMKAVENGNIVLGMCCKDGALLGSVKTQHSKLMVADTYRRVFALDKCAGFVAAGLFADSRAVMNHARSECWNYKSNYGVNISGGVLADRIAGMMHAYTLYWSVRPFGCAALVCHMDDGIPSLYQITPDGVCSKYFGVAIGKGSQLAKTELEKCDFKNMTCEEAVPVATKIILKAHEKVGDKKIQVEMGSISPSTNGEFRRVDQEKMENVVEQTFKDIDDEEHEDD